ncbi:MAG: hypothetical protein HFH15_14475 [Ruminococcus sp.]|jgi:hypothetical protein|nr:hypothetical protein [Ruminococcus sp.]
MKNVETMASEKEKLRQLQGFKKLQYLWDYYKLHFAAACIILYILGYVLYGHFTQKQNILYAAFINVAPSEALTKALSDGFLLSQDLNPAKNAFYLYTGLYLTSDEANPYHEYTYASRIKLIAAIDNETLDIALMDQEAFDTFSQNGYLDNMEDFLLETDPGLYQDCLKLLRDNIVILEDNAEDAALDSSVSYTAKTEEYPMALEITHTPLLEDAGFTEPVYLGIIKNTPREKEAAEYIRYLNQFPCLR